MRFVSTTFLALTHPLSSEVFAALGYDVSVAAERLAFTVYMSLWRSIGEPLDWDGRLLLSAEEVEAALSSFDAEIYVARVRGEAVGLCEFSKSRSFGSEIVYFGLIQAFQGQRLGPCLLNAALHKHWKANRPRCVWLHTDTWDDPKALPLYKRFGFRVFATLDMPETATEEDYRIVAHAQLTSSILDQGEYCD